MITVCGLVSPFESSTATVKPEGAEIVGGESAPPGKILNVAGTRAPFGAGGDVRAEPGAGVEVVVVLVEVAAEVVVEAPGEAPGEAAVEAVVEAAVEAVRVTVDDVPRDPPHPASRRTRSGPRTFSRRLTLAA